MSDPTVGGQIVPGTPSPDGAWVWTGGGWVQASQAQYSPDRAYIWNGTQWLPNAGGGPAPTPVTPVPIPNTPVPVASAAAPNASWGAPRTTPKGHTARNVAIGVGVLIVVAAIISNAAKGPTPTASTNTNAVVSVTPTSTPSPASSPEPSASPTPTPKPTPSPTPRPSPTPPPKGPTVLLDKYGNGGGGNTPIFHTTGEWTITYDFDCTAFGFNGNFQIYVYDGTSALKDVPVNSLAMKGTDTVYEHNLSGPYYLTINTECNWHIIVKG
jgi:hypothetical protein